MRIVSDDGQMIELGMPWSVRILALFFIVTGIGATATFLDPDLAPRYMHLPLVGPMVVLVGLLMISSQEHVEIDFLAQEIRVRRWNILKRSNVTYPFHTIDELVIEPFAVPRTRMRKVPIYRLCVNEPGVATMITDDLSEKKIERLAERIAERAGAEILIIEDDDTEDDDDDVEADTAE